MKLLVLSNQPYITQTYSSHKTKNSSEQISYTHVPLFGNIHSQTNSATFHLFLLRIEEGSRSDMVMNFELLYGFESDQKQPRIFKLLDGVHLVPLHHYLPLTVHL